jgi:2-oxo-hept-3-ene-1,7-dioate hydratase
MIDKKTARELAVKLHESEKSGVQIPQISLQYPDMSIGDAYAIQHEWVSMKIAEGQVVKGHKIGLTSRAMQQSSQIDEPDYGTLLDTMFFADGSEIDISRFIDPMVEVELAFILGKKLEGENVTIFDVLNATEFMTPALEIIDARIQRVDPESGRPRKVMDTISDNAANAGIVTGGRPFKPAEVDLRWVGALLYRNGIIEETGLAAGVLNHPANGVSWLCKRFAPHNIALEPGQIILGGSFTRPVRASKGDTFHADYGPLGGISCRFI